ncbi:unnamed protein product [Rangifer tarandus platyrhynchus]|uniref:Uncharacterized protein n=2 Tax=Rangifer tarandus platyrhynchus TaxID=3082113 RepID=A0ABN8Z645_RANTA|nr:unnamed protein product [Rangifer tarandus platyrhynchus]CAI9703546.1 unnamed protein product [Rangifer tarandus platyrhynchus]
MSGSRSLVDPQVRARAVGIPPAWRTRREMPAELTEAKGSGKRWEDARAGRLEGRPSKAASALPLQLPHCGGPGPQPPSVASPPLSQQPVPLCALTPR